MTDKPIACDLHDYLEIACMHQYRVRLTLKGGRSLEGIAKNIITQDKHEYLLIDTGHAEQVDLTRLTKLETLTSNAQFKVVNF